MPAAPDGTPRAAILACADHQKRDVALRVLARGGELVICEKGYAGRDLEDAPRERYDATILRPARANEPGHRPMPSWICQRIESIL